ncbi:MAG: proline--tRNA ligase, partial [Cyanobacteria bacterium REEB65]|nr:proline--tRNA ligase [Cyanobacteria bacterium REEB65]
YQIQSKFRDEIRPRFGLLRGREFVMKDAYSFHDSAASLEETYDVMCRTYTRIFERCGLATRMVESDVGAIGGSAAHEFMVVVETAGGENDILYCDSCHYAANVERAESKLAPSSAAAEPKRERRKVPTPGIRTVDEQAAMLQIGKDRIVKTVLCVATWNEADGSLRRQPVLALVRGDLEVNLVKLGNAAGSHEIRSASPEEVLELAGVEPGFVGPFALPAEVRVVADWSVQDLTNFSTGAGEKDMHWIDANWGSEGSPSRWADIRQAQIGETCGRCERGKLLQTKGIEVGNTFKLGTKYSKAMNAVYDAPDGSEQPFVMGCYGIGITRTAQAAAEACHDEFGIQWPAAIAPYHLVVVPANPQDSVAMQVAEDLYQQAWSCGIEAVLDDRDERAGVKFKDADLIGFPFRLTIGKALKDGRVELKVRATGEVSELPVAETLGYLRQLLGSVLDRRHGEAALIGL